MNQREVHQPTHLELQIGSMNFSTSLLTLWKELAADLTFIGIHNAWDVVTYMAFERSRPQDNKFGK